MADDVILSDPPAEAPAWLAGIDESALIREGDKDVPLRSHPSLASFKDVTSVAKSFVETKRMVGTKLDGMVKVPGETATPEERSAWNAATGVPESPDKYGIEWPTLPEGSAWNPQQQAEGLKVLHDLGISAKQAPGLVALYTQMELQRQDAETQAAAAKRGEAEAALAKAWGPKDSPLYKRNVAVAREALRVVADKIGDPTVAEYLEEHGNDPRLVRFLTTVGEDYLESGSITSDLPGGLSPDEAQRRIDAMRADKTNAFHNPMHPDHQASNDEMLRLTALSLRGRAAA